MFRSALAALACVFGTGAFASDCNIDQLDIRYNGDSFRFTVEVADTNEERGTGLMNREFMPQFSGMIFVFDGPQRVSFWMKNTLIPLDMLFIDETGVVQRIHSNAIPHDLTSIPGGDQIQFVLEINGSMADLLGIKVGAEIRHPEIANDLAIWPCNE